MKNALWPTHDSTIERLEKIGIEERYQRIIHYNFDDEDWEKFSPSEDELAEAIGEILIRNKLDIESAYVLTGVFKALISGIAGIKLTAKKNSPTEHAKRMELRDKRYAAAGKHALFRNAKGIKMESAVAESMAIYGFSRRDVFRAVRDMRASFKRFERLFPELSSAIKMLD